MEISAPLVSALLRKRKIVGHRTGLKCGKASFGATEKQEAH